MIRTMSLLAIDVNDQLKLKILWTNTHKKSNSDCGTVSIADGPSSFWFAKFKHHPLDCLYYCLYCLGNVSFLVTYFLVNLSKDL